MTGFIPRMLRWPLRLGAAAATGAVILATAVPGAFGEVGTSGKDQAQQALKHVQANSAAIHHASDQAKGLTGKANAAAQHARDAADKAAKQADQVSKEAGDYATTYVEVADAVATVSADATAAESAADSAQAGADSAAAAADQLLQYTSLVNDAVQQTTADVKTADQDTTAVTDAINQAAVSDQWATDSTTQLATVQTSYATATQSQTDATVAQQTTQTDAASSTTLIRTAYRTSGAGLTPIAISSGSGGSTGDTSGSGSTGGGSTGDTTTSTGSDSTSSGSTGDTTGSTGGGSTGDVSGSTGGSSTGSVSGSTGDTSASPGSGSTDSGSPSSGSPGGGSTGDVGGVPAPGVGTAVPPVHVQPPAQGHGVVMVVRPESPVRVGTARQVPSTVSSWQTLTRALAVTAVNSSHPAGRTHSTAARSAPAATTTQGVEAMAPIRRQPAQAAPVGILDHPLTATDFGAVPVLTVLLFVEALILGRRLAARRRRRPRSGLATV